MQLDVRHCILGGEYVIDIKTTGDFSNITRFLDKMSKRDAKAVLNKYGNRGVELLESATPIKTGKTASSWRYEIKYSRGKYEIQWMNDNVNNGVNIAIILQYGHGTRNGGYVAGIDYINPVIRQVFEEMADELWREVVQA